MPDVDFEVERLIPVPRRGTVLVGTVVAGTVQVGDVFEFRGVTARCDGIEVGRRLLDAAGPGDRVGVLLAADFGIATPTKDVVPEHLSRAG